MTSCLFDVGKAVSLKMIKRVTHCQILMAVFNCNQCKYRRSDFSLRASSHYNSKDTWVLVHYVTDDFMRMCHQVEAWYRRSYMLPLQQLQPGNTASVCRLLANVTVDSSRHGSNLSLAKWLWLLLEYRFELCQMATACSRHLFVLFIITHCRLIQIQAGVHARSTAWRVLLLYCRGVSCSNSPVLVLSLEDFAKIKRCEILLLRERVRGRGIWWLMHLCFVFLWGRVIPGYRFTDDVKHLCIGAEVKRRVIMLRWLTFKCKPLKKNFFLIISCKYTPVPESIFCMMFSTYKATIAHLNYTGQESTKHCLWVILLTCGLDTKSRSWNLVWIDRPQAMI